jgi:hypothetical protein
MGKSTGIQLFFMTASPTFSNLAPWRQFSAISARAAGRAHRVQCVGRPLSKQLKYPTFFISSLFVEEVHLVKLKKCASEIGELLAFSGIADVTYLQWS